MKQSLGFGWEVAVIRRGEIGEKGRKVRN